MIAYVLFSKEISRVFNDVSRNYEQWSFLPDTMHCSLAFLAVYAIFRKFSFFLEKVNLRLLLGQFFQLDLIQISLDATSGLI